MKIGRLNISKSFPCVVRFKPKFFMLRFLFSATGLLLSVCSFAQFTVSGVVTDSRTQEALTGASVSLGTANVTATDQSGSFRFENVSAGEYVLQVTFVGYSALSKKMKVAKNETISFSLEPSVTFTDAVVISAIRATDKTPTTFTNIDKEAITKQNFGQDVPFLLNWTPSVVTTSDAGAGIGYTGIRIRGSDGTRINVTINGVPYNDSESLGTFWVDIPDIASSSQSIQIQRGVGTSTNGGGAFGASINLQTNTRNDKPYAQAINSFGSFNSRRHTLGFGTGLMNNHWIVEGRVSKIASDGFIDRATSDLNSYYFSASYHAKNTVIKALTFGGHERTYQAWYGVPLSRLNNNLEAMEATVGNEGWNEEQRQNLLNSNSRTFNPYTYKDQVDDYRQDNYQLHFSHQFTSAFTLNTSLHYTPGKGYYEEYRYNDKFSNYGMPSVTIGDSVVTSSDLVRRRWLNNDFYGLTYSLNYDKEKWNVILGGGWNRYDGDHYGNLIWAKVSPAAPGSQYYLNNGDKRDGNIFMKINYAFATSLNAFIDLQTRQVSYKASGIENEQQAININAKFNFFNPKLGLTWSVREHQQLYASYAVAHREPLRDDFVNFPGTSPKAESLGNLEVGLRNTGSKHVFHANFYRMDYKNQLVLTGQLNDVGAQIRTNTGQSYRMGIELEGSVKLMKSLQWSANLTLSRNKIKEYVDILHDYADDSDVKTRYTNTDISFSPNAIAGSQLAFFPFKGAEMTLLTKYVGKQYLDNTSTKDRTVTAYLVNDVRLAYKWKPEFAKEILFSLLINNVLDKKYQSNGYTWAYLYGGGAAYRETYYYPQAGRNFMAMISIKI
jgi:iron complex outermembrane receptor protein